MSGATTRQLWLQQPLAPGVLSALPSSFEICKPLALLCACHGLRVCALHLEAVPGAVKEPDLLGSVSRGRAQQRRQQMSVAHGAYEWMCLVGCSRCDCVKTAGEGAGWRKRRGCEQCGMPQNEPMKGEAKPAKRDTTRRDALGGTRDQYSEQIVELSLIVRASRGRESNVEVQEGFE